MVAEFGYVHRLTDAEIITTFPHRRVPIASIRRVTEEVHIRLRFEDVQNDDTTPVTEAC